MKRALLAATVLVPVAGVAAAPARAVVMVEDVITETHTGMTWMQTLQSAVNSAKSVVNEGKMILNQGAQIANQVRQIEHLYNTLNAVRHGNLYAARSLIPELAALGLVDPYDGDVKDMRDLINGATDVALWGNDLAGLARNYRQGWHGYVPSSRDYAGASINAGAAAASAQAVAGGRLVETAGERSRRLADLNRTAAGATADIKDSMDLAARAAIEGGVASQQAAQGVGMLVQQEARREQREVQNAMMARASADTLAESARLAYAQSKSGQVSLFVGSHGRRVAFASPEMQPTTPTGEAAVSPVSATATYTPGAGADAVATMTRNLGDNTVSEAARFGVTAEATAAVCMAESGCRAIGAHGGAGTAAGSFGYTDGTFRENAARAGYGSGAGRTDPTVQAGITASDLSRYARTLQGAGITNPTALDAYGFHMFGPAEGVAVATASADTPLDLALQHTSAQTLANNGLTGKTVGQWRDSVSKRMGGSATAPVLSSPVLKS